MCLDRCITERQKKYFRYRKENGYSVGYKLYIKNRRQGFVTPLHFGKSQPIGKWINERDFRQKKSIDSIFYLHGHSSYPAGFHLYLRKKHAQQEIDYHTWNPMIIKKVYFMKACARGLQDRKPIVVAKDIFVVAN